MDNKYPSAPELSGKHTGHYDAETNEKTVEESADSATPKLQLINSTKPPEADAEEPTDDDEPLAPEDDDELNENVEQPGDPDGVVAQDKIHEWQKQHPLPVEAPKRKHPWRKVFITLVIITALAAAAFWYGNNRASAPSKQSATTKTQSQQPAAAASSAPAATTHYDSSTYTLSFDYPQPWKVTDTSAKLTVTSPEVSLTGASGQTVKAHVVVSIQNQQSTIAGYPTGGALAALASDKLSYKKPTQIQRAQTYVSYLSYSQQSKLDAVYVTGDNGYQPGQSVPMSDVAKGNPLVSVAFLNCSTVDCGNGGSAVTLQASAWKSSQASKDVTALIESLQLN